MGRVAQLICEKDPSAGELFSMRHAATVTKLLRQYAAMEASGVQSGEMNRSLARIAEALTLTGHAFEQELDSLFRTDMLDIDAESEAYLQSLKNRGLIT
jgi:5-bromo-4-chloroindolyl phosphate hydrolysis protein